METPDRRLTRSGFVNYIDRSRDFYAARGFDRPYEWPSFDEVPFAELSKPLMEARVALVTTASLFVNDVATADRPPKVVYHHAVEARPARMFTDDLSWDKEATHTNDPETFLPLGRLGEFAAEGRIGCLNHRFFGAPTEYSQRRSGLDAEVIADWCADDEVDAVVLVPL